MKYLHLLLLLTLLQIGCQEDQEKKAARMAYENFMDAVIANNGDAAYEYLSHYDIEYYSKILRITQTGTREDIAPLDAIDKVAIIGARMKFDKSELLNFNTKSFYSNSIKGGVIGKNKEMMKVPIESVEINKGENNSSYAILKAHNPGANIVGDHEELEFFVYNESGTWKYRVTLNNFMANEYLERQLLFSKPNDINEEDFIANALAKQYGKSNSNVIDNY